MTSGPAHSGPASGGGAFERERYAPAAGAEPSIAELIGGLIGDAQILMRREIDLAKQEVTNEIDKAKQGLVALGAGAAVATIGGLLLAHMLVYLVQDLTGLSLWLSFLIVGGVLALIGALLLSRGAKQMQKIDPVPRETIDSVRKDVEWITEHSQSEKT